MKTGASASQQCVVEIKKMGNSEVIGKMLETSNQRYQVYDKDLLCPTLQAAMGTGGGNCPYFVDEKQIVAMRGRNPENPSDRTAGIHLEQRLEPNSENMCNTLTSVQKDNLVLETLDVQGMRMVRTEEGKRLRKQYETGEIKHGFNEFREPEMKTDGISNTISTVLKDTEICETKTIKIKQATKDGFVECEIPGIADLNYVSSTTRRGRVQENGKMCPTLCAENVPSLIELGDPDFYNFLYCIDGQIYLIRIRKLIPLECWRLMGFTDEDFHKAEKVNSNTQLYKQAGNSIVKNCLMAIYKQML